MANRSDRLEGIARLKRWLTLPIALWGAVIIVFFGRLPFLRDGYGADPDAHRLAVAACRILRTGHYTLSREPGHPLQEIVTAPLCSLGPLGFNLGTALLSSLCVLFFGLVVRRFRAALAPLLVLALGYSPLFWVHSVDAMDYIWAISLGWMAVYCSLRGYAIRAGVALGLAIGCRVTEGVTLLPCLLLLQGHVAARNLRNSRLMLAFAAGLTALLLYVPVFATYGKAALQVYDTGRPHLSRVLTQMFIEPWGVAGLLTLGVAITAAVLRHVPLMRSSVPTYEGVERKLLLASGAVIATTVLLYLRLPHDAGYLLPAVPWVLLTMTLVSSPYWVIALLFSIGLANVPVPKLWKSPIQSARHERRVQVRRVDRMIAAMRSLPNSSVVVAGTYQPKILSQLGNAPIDGVSVVYLLSNSEATQLHNASRAIYYVDRALAQNVQLRRFDLRSVGAKLLIWQP